MKSLSTLRKSTLVLLSVLSVLGAVACSSRPAAAQVDGVIAGVLPVAPNQIYLFANGYETLTGGATQWVARYQIFNSSGVDIITGQDPLPNPTYPTGTQVTIGENIYVTVPGPGNYTVIWYGMFNGSGPFWWSFYDYPVTVS